jgi:insertion element IS1 protein InsB
MLSFVGKKQNKQWIWLAMDVYCLQIIAFHVGDRSRVSAQAQKEVDTRKLQETCDFLYRWMASLRRCHSSKATSGRQEAKADNQSYRTIQLHLETLGVSSGQKIALVKKKLANHIGAIKYFICHYNLEKGLHV